MAVVSLNQILGGKSVMPDEKIVPFPRQVIGKKSRVISLEFQRGNNIIRSPRILSRRDTTSFTITNEDEASVIVRFFREHTSDKPSDKP